MFLRRNYKIHRTILTFLINRIVMSSWEKIVFFARWLEAGEKCRRKTIEINGTQTFPSAAGDTVFYEESVYNYPMGHKCYRIMYTDIERARATNEPSDITLICNFHQISNNIISTHLLPIECCLKHNTYLIAGCNTIRRISIIIFSDDDGDETKRRDTNYCSNPTKAFKSAAATGSVAEMMSSFEISYARQSYDLCPSKGIVQITPRHTYFTNLLYVFTFIV